MSTEIKKEIKLEIGHVLFMDIVGYSTRLINEQRALRDALNQIVRSTEQFRDADAAGTLIKSPTGDGMALVFHRSPEEPVECALEISRALKTHPNLPLRMGVHSGPVSGVIDVNEQTSVAGAGINMAQRVMDCGDAGHILLSKHVAEDLEHYGHWQPHLHDLGECEVKHGVRVSVVNLYTEELGNPEPPEKFKHLRGKKKISAAISESSTKATSLRWFLVVAAVLIVVSLVVAMWSFWHWPSPKPVSVSAPVRVASAAPAIPEKSIAVLPFENLSRDPDNAFFANGIQDEILTRLAKIGALKVISRTSTRQYESNPGNLAEIAKQLGVANILEGSVQKAGEQVRVNVQLINAQTDSHLWAETYDRRLIDIFQVESEVATEVAIALRAKLDPEEKARLEAKPTNNSDAYVLYLKAREREGGVDTTMEDWIAAEQLYAQAIALDPAFVLAYARASITNSRIFDSNNDEARKSKARAQAEEALRLSPTMGEAHFALGLYLWLCERDFDPALKELFIAEKTSPNNAEIFWYSAAIYRNQGRWRESLASAQRAQNLDPRNAQIALYVAYNHCLVRDWPTGAAGFNRLLEIAPDSVFGRIALAYLEVIRNGNLAGAEAILQKIPTGINPEGEVTDAKWDLSMLERDFASAEKILNTFPSDEEFPTSNRPPKAFYQGCTALARGDTRLAQAFFDTVTPIFEAKVRDHPDDRWRHADVGLLYAYLGRKEDAVREGRRAVELAPERKEPHRRVLLESSLALFTPAPARQIKRSR
jgi:TolB-like protein/class 3 adenylate cyclase/Flp pilus assembly protein TadD